MNEAMNFTYGDLIMIELTLLSYVKEIDLSLQSGQYFSELIGKIEYNLSEIKAAAGQQLSPVV